MVSLSGSEQPRQTGYASGPSRQQSRVQKISLLLCLGSQGQGWGDLRSRDSGSSLVVLEEPPLHKPQGAVLTPHLLRSHRRSHREDLPRPRLEMVSRSAKLLVSRMAWGSRSVKGSKSL